MTTRDVTIHGGLHEPTRGSRRRFNHDSSDAPRARLTTDDDLDELPLHALSRRRRGQCCDYDSDPCDWTDLPTVTRHLRWLIV